MATDKTDLTRGGYSLRNRDLRKQSDRLPPQPGRPRTRGDCDPNAGLPNSMRPCPWIGCKYHLWADVTRFGSIYLPHGDNIPEEGESCALDVADARAAECSEISQNLGFSAELIRVTLRRLLVKLSGRYDKQALKEEPTEERGIWHETR